MTRVAFMLKAMGAKEIEMSQAQWGEICTLAEQRVMLRYGYNEREVALAGLRRRYTKFAGLHIIIRG